MRFMTFVFHQISKFDWNFIWLSILATPMMSPAPTQDSMGYSLGSGYDPQQAYDGSMGYDPSLHQDLSPWE